MPELANTAGGKLVFDDEGAGRPLLFVHGWATHADFFGPQRAALAREFRVISLDLAGHRRSPACKAPLTIEHLAQDLITLCRHLSLEDAVAVGWSMGAMAVWSALLTGAGQHISGHVVIDMSPRILNGPDWHLGLKGSQSSGLSPRTEAAMRHHWQGYTPRIARRIFASGHDAERAALLQWAEQEIARSDGAVMAGLWSSMIAQDYRADLARLETPTLVAHGLRSQLYAPETAAFLAANLPQAHACAFSRSGHAPHLEEPDAFNRMVADFARSGRRAAMTGNTAQSDDKSIKGRKS
ncbi:MAG TPA: alpha/beta hydrolase [Pedomonas sp.]|uniref:alpha/beta fold hydrolase n=1 Tax=Pedomonas sp. TaxID=2976421 RepID=UPI002F42A1B6